MIKRKPDELFYDYCARRLVEQEEQKEKLQPRVIWTSTILVPDASKKDLPEHLRPLVKMQVRGTFDRSKGHRMPNSLSEKHRRERMLKRLRRKGIIKNET